MVLLTYERAKQAAFIDDVIVATDSEEIASVIHNAGGQAILTDEHLPTGTERVAKAAEQYPDHDVIINLQGDEPFIKPKMLHELVKPYLTGETPEMTTLAYPLVNEKYHCPGSVKVIVDKKHHALYFSRAPIPYFREQGADAPVYNHMGLYAFRRDFLMLYKNLPQTPLEKIESLEQLRVLEHGYKIRVCFTDEATLEINTPEEYQKAQIFQYIS